MTSLSVAKPSGTQEGDIMIAMVVKKDANLPNSVPSGWTLIGNSGPANCYMFLYYKVAGASEPSSYSWGFTQSSICRILCVSYRGGFNTSDPIDTYTMPLYTSVDWTLRCAYPITPTSVGENLIYFAAHYYPLSDPQVFSQPSGFVERYDGYNTVSEYHCSFGDRYYYSINPLYVNSGLGTGSNYTGKQGCVIALKPSL